MRKNKLTKIELDYKWFEKKVNIQIYIFIALTVIFGVTILLTDNKIFLLIAAILLAFIWVSELFICVSVNKKRNKYLELLKRERDSIKRTGIFSEIYEEYWHDGFEFNLIYDKLVYCEYYNNSIDIALLKNKHEILIEIDNSSISIIVDEETDNPKEMKTSLLDVSSIEQVYCAINDFIKSNS